MVSTKVLIFLKMKSFKKQLIKALTIATDEGVILNADSLIIKMLKNKIK